MNLVLMTSHSINPALRYPPYCFDCLRLQSGWKPAAAETPPEVYQLHSSGVRGCFQISLAIFFVDTANAFPTHGGNIRGTYNWQLYKHFSHFHLSPSPVPGLIAVVLWHKKMEEGNCLGNSKVSTQACRRTDLTRT